jgi:membrane associated rhomboid family serine protease
LKRFPGTFGIVIGCTLIQLISVLYPDLTNKLAFDSAAYGGWFNIISCIVTHASWSHLIGNLSLGTPFMLYVEARLGWRQFIEYFFLCGMLGAATQGLLGGPVLLVGASGALFGMKAGACLLFGDTKAEHWLALVVLGVTLATQFSMLQAGDIGIAVWAHIGGAFGGIVFLHKFYLPKKD